MRANTQICTVNTNVMHTNTQTQVNKSTVYPATSKSLGMLTSTTVAHTDTSADETTEHYKERQAQPH